MVNVAAPEYQYVTQQSNVDGVADVGTHSNFTAQQYGPDNIYDTLTEANTNGTPYISITFTNTQSSATPNPFQEQITWNPSSYTSYEASDLGNIRFYSDNALTTPLYAWLESCTPSLNNTATSVTAWVKLTTPIAANGGTLTIYMAFLSASTDFDGNYWGDAPNLSPTYGQYDNGVNVFSFYDNFAGNTISSAWNTAGAAGTYSVNNGLTVNSNPFPGYSFSLNNQYTGPLIVDAYQVGTTGDWIGASFSNLQTTSGSYTVTSGAAQWVYPPEGADGINGLSIASGSTAFTPNPPSTNLQVVTLAVNSTAATEYQNYANPVTASGTISLTNYPGLVQVAYNPSDTQTTYWFRLRAYPPNNVNPSASFGSLTLPNYRLDIEEQWTNVSTATNEELDIYMGAFSAPASILSVQWYNATGSSWLTIISSLNASAWNNVTVVNYLTSSTFTIQFVNTTSGGTQSWWQVDCALLHLWTASTYDPVLNVVNQVTNAWNVSLQVYGSSSIARLTSGTISFHDGTSSQQIVVNGGSIVQSQGALYNLLGGSGTTVYVSVSNLLANATGTSYLYVNLEILTPNTSTYLAYAITFAMT
jgi:hypothetical protein